jgi:hypothetical protein
MAAFGIDPSIVLFFALFFALALPPISDGCNPLPTHNKENGAGF